MAKRKPVGATERGRPGATGPPAASDRGPPRPAKRPADTKRTSGLRMTPGAKAGQSLWLFGRHSVLAALANPRRRPRRLLATAETREEITVALAQSPGGAALPAVELAPRADIAKLLPPGAVHQGIALEVPPLPQPDLADWLRRREAAKQEGPGPDAAAEPRDIIVVLDQVTDPHNVGAILRSAAAFGARAVLTTHKNAAPESGTLAKSASGAFEHLPYITVPNLGRGLASLKEAGYWCLGLAGEARQDLATADPGGPLALVLGAEGDGLRRLTRSQCDLLARLPTHGPIESLNVSNAAAVALYAVAVARDP